LGKQRQNSGSSQKAQHRAERHSLFPTKQAKLNSLLWLFEPLEDDPRFIRKKFFFADAACLEGNLCLALVDRKDPWNGLLVCTSREHHGSLQSQFPALVPHDVLGKWLYLPQSHPEFEMVAPQIVELLLQHDRRLGVESNTRKRPRSKPRSEP
jgi:hypothetical protein